LSRARHGAADPGLGGAVGARGSAPRLRAPRGAARRQAVGRRADPDAAAADPLSDPAEHALLQSRLLPSGAEARGQAALLLHEDPRREMLRARRDQDALLVVVHDGGRVRRALQRSRVSGAEGEIRPRRARPHALLEGRAAPVDGSASRGGYDAPDNACCSIFAQLSRSVTVRLNTGWPGFESTGSTKK